MPLFILILISIVPSFAENAETMAKGKSGIVAIDTLSVHEWDIDTHRQNLVTTLGLGLLIPGGAQFYTKHYVRGSFLLAIELGLAYEIWINKSWQRQIRLRDMAPAQDSVAYYTKLLFEHGGYNPTWQQKRHYHLQQVREINDIKVKEDDLRYSETAWLIGLHLYGVLDGFGIWVNNQGRSHRKIEVSDAVWRALLLPGYGQIYNREYGKAGLLYMAAIGVVASFKSRQGVVEYFSDRKITAEAENASTAELSAIEEEILFFRKKRNQYIWGMALIYLYSIADAAVDAALSDFDSPAYWAVIPQWRGLGLSFNARF